MNAEDFFPIKYNGNPITYVEHILYPSASLLSSISDILYYSICSLKGQLYVKTKIKFLSLVYMCYLMAQSF